MIYIIKIVFMIHIRYLYLYGLTLIFKWLEPINSQFKKRTNQFIIKPNGFELETYKLNSFLVTTIAYINDYTMLYAFKEHEVAGSPERNMVLTIDKQAHVWGNIWTNVLSSYPHIHTHTQISSITYMCAYKFLYAERTCT